MERDTFRIILAVGLVVGIVTGAVFGPVLAQSVASFLSPDVPVDGEIPVGHPDGATVYTNTNSEEMDLSNFTASDRLYISTSTGNVSVYSNGDTSMDVHPGVNLTGAWTNVTDVTAGSTWIEVYPVDKDRFDIRGDVDAFSLSDTVALGDEKVDFYYSGTDGGVVDTTLYNLSSNTQIAAIDANSMEFLDVATSDSNGNLSLSLPASSHAVELVNADDSVDPEATNTGPNDVVVENTVSFSADISDGDYPYDELTANLTFTNHNQNDVVVNSTTLNANGTVELSHTFTTATETDYYFNITDAYGNSVETQSKTVYSLGDLSLNSESVSINNSIFSSPGSVDFTIDRYDNNWLNISDATAGSDWIEINPYWTQRVDVRGDVNALSIRDMQLDDGQTDFYYAGTDGGLVSVKAYDLPANQRILAYDESNQIVADETTDSNGVVTFDLSASAHSISLESYEPVPPSLSNASPTGLLDTEPPELSVSVDDDQFNNGDSVTVNLTLDGTQIHSETITSAQTVTTSIPQSGQTAGQHDWRVNATDSFGESTLAEYSYSIPDSLYIRNELNHTELITDPVNATVTFFGPETTYERETSDGTVDMTDLPVNADFTVTVNPSDSNWTSRTTYIQSIYEQQSVYLLNTTAVDSAVQNRFILEDPTGTYGSQSTLYIQRPIEVNGTVTYQTIHADEFGVEGVTATLEEGIRYRIKIGQNGDSQIVGPYRAELTETVTIEPESPGIDVEDYTQGYGYNASMTNQTVTWAYDDPEQQTDRLTVYIHEQGDPDSLLVPNETFFDLGNASNEFQITQNESETSWVVNFVIDRDGESLTHSVNIANTKDLFGELSPGWQAAIGIALLILLAGAFSVLNAAVGAVVVSLTAGLLWWIGLLSGVTSAIGIAIALFISVLYYMAAQRTP